MRAPRHPQTDVQRFLLDGGKLTDLETRYAIKAKRHGKLPHLVLLKYDQIASPFAESIVRECRGIILEESDNWRVVCRPFSKFFNAGEMLAAPIDWSTARAREKLDGSLMTLFCYRGEWLVASSGMPDASGEVGDFGKSFSNLFWETFRKMNLRPPDNESLCIMFELTSPLNLIVVRHTEAKLTAIGCRHVPSGEEIRVEELADIYPVVRSFPLTTAEEVAAAAEACDPLAQEGFVVEDAHFNRIKVKGSRYVALHHLRDGFSMRRITLLVATGETQEMLAYFPEFRTRFEEVQARFDRLATETDEVRQAVLQAVGTPDNGIAYGCDGVGRGDKAYAKAYALEVQRLGARCPAALYAMRNGKAASAREFLHGMAQKSVRGLMDVLGVRDAEF